MKVTLLGDSIRQQYGKKVEQLLGPNFDVWQPHENCRFAKYTLRGLFDWMENMDGSDIVHWNNGHWDICRLFDDDTFSSKDEYVENMIRIADILQKRYQTVIFATTTPVRMTNLHNSNEDIDCFNRLIVPLLMERGVIINDLNKLFRSNIDKYICDDTIHLTEAGIDISAKHVVECIENASKNISAIYANKVQKNEVKSKGKCGAPVLL